MIDHKEMKELPSGTQFFRADLHIHSYGGSHDVKDETLTPQNIAKSAKKEGLSLIAITDHNEITNVQAILEAAAKEGIIALPGIELSTSDGHLLAYFETYDNLQKFWSNIEVKDRNTPNSRCQTSMLDCLKKITLNNGFAILAHVDSPKGLETMQSTNSLVKQDILSEQALVGIELVTSESKISYSPSDEDDQRKELGRIRSERLKLASEQCLARVMFSDAHTLSGLGHNAKNDRKVTRFKAAEPSFDSFLHALRFADARIRLEEEVPPTIPFIKGITIEGGFLDGQSIRLNRNLNCIIGGRGTGKSTLMEALRSIGFKDSLSKLVDSEVWPETLRIFWQDEVSDIHVLERDKNGELSNIEDPNGPSAFGIESYSQSELTINDHPSDLLRFLDQFTHVSHLQAEDEQIRNELLDNQNKIEELSRDVKQLPEIKKWRDETKRQLKILEDAKGSEIVRLERALADEQHVREEIDEFLKSIWSDFSAADPEENLSEKLNDMTKERSMSSIGKTVVNEIIELAKDVEPNTHPHRKQIKTIGKNFYRAASEQIDGWKKKESELRNKIANKKTELAEQGITLDTAYIKKLTKDEVEANKQIKNLSTKSKTLKQLNKERTELIKRRIACRDKIWAMRDGYATRSNKILSGSLGDLHVTIRFKKTTLSEEAAGLIKDVLNWRTAKVPKAHLLIEQLPLFDLIDDVQRNEQERILAIENDGIKVFSRTDAEDIINELKKPENLHRLQRIEVEDKPFITVTATPAGAAKPIARDFSRLSLGQKQSILLSLMLADTSSTMPLIIDQPEDNLDSQFIYRSLVSALRHAKERRQVIVVTHNPNIAVLGDADQIIILKSFSDRGTVFTTGAIDHEHTRKEACEVLEGTSEAFQRRSEIYGL